MLVQGMSPSSSNGHLSQTYKPTLLYCYTLCSIFHIYMLVHMHGGFHIYAYGRSTTFKPGPSSSNGDLSQTYRPTLLYCYIYDAVLSKTTLFHLGA